MAQSPNKALSLIFLTIAIDLIGFGIILPNLPLYAEALGAKPAMIGVLFASYSVMQFLCAPFLGRLSDRIGRRPVLLMSIAGNCLAFLIFGFANSFALLLASRLFSGMCTANLSVANAYVADLLPPERRAKGMGLVGAAFGIGFVIGPVIGGELSVFARSAPPLFAAGLCALNLLGAYFWLPETLRREALQVRPKVSIRQALTQPFTGKILFLVFFQIMAFSMLEMAFVLFAERRLHFMALQSGRMFMYIGLVLVLVQGAMIGPLVRKLGERAVVIIGMSMIALGMLLIPWTPQGGWLLFSLCVTIVAFGQALTSPSLSSLLSRRSAVQLQGTILGASQSMSALARVVGPSLAGMLYQTFSENAPFYAGGMMTALVTTWACTQLFTESS
jgi:MFS transporter, DHA1 family, tetracycline resistance protein